MTQRFIEIDRPRKLNDLLREEGYQQYRIPLLIQCGAIKVFQKGSLLPVSKLRPEMRLSEDDKLMVMEPLSTSCEKGLANIPSSDFRDYAFAPGQTPYDLQMRSLLEARPQTILVSEEFQHGLVDFFRKLRTSPQIDHPIRNLIIASHANPEGNLLIPFDEWEAKTITYETLEKIQTGFQLSPEILKPRPIDEHGKPLDSWLHIRGCRIGMERARPLLLLLHKVLGGSVRVSAPKHFHHAARITRPAGYIEYMSYGFDIYQSTALKSRVDLMAALVDSQLKDVNGDEITEEQLNTWIPSNWIPPQKRAKRLTPPRGLCRRYVEDLRVMRVGIQLLNSNQHFPLNSYLRYCERQIFDSEASLQLPTDPGSTKAQQRIICDELMKQYPSSYPVYARFGYKTMDDFMDGCHWDIKWNKSDNTLRFQATRHEYTLRVPIVNQPTNQLFSNFYPSDRQRPANPGLRESDTRFFSSVP